MSRVRCKTISYSNLLYQSDAKQFTSLEREIFFFSFDFFQKFDSLFTGYVTISLKVQWVIRPQCAALADSTLECLRVAENRFLLVWLTTVNEVCFFVVV